MIAIFTPWLFDVSRLVMETFFYPMAVVLFLLALYAAQKKEDWSWLNIVTALAATLMLLTYSYTIGRSVRPVTGAADWCSSPPRRPRSNRIVKTWVAYGLHTNSLVDFQIEES